MGAVHGIDDCWCAGAGAASPALLCPCCCEGAAKVVMLQWAKRSRTSRVCNGIHHNAARQQTTAAAAAAITGGWRPASRHTLRRKCLHNQAIIHACGWHVMSAVCNDRQLQARQQLLKNSSMSVLLPSFASRPAADNCWLRQH